MYLRQNAGMLRLETQCAGPITLHKHVRSHEMLDLSFASLLKRYILGLRTGKDASRVHDFGELGRKIFPGHLRSLQHVVAAKRGSLSWSLSCNAGDLDEKIDQV